MSPERVRELHEAVLDLLREGGYQSLTMEAVAARTRCSKSTLYRQWKGKPGLVAAALRTCRHRPLGDIDTGSLAEDLRAAARAIGDRAVRETNLIHAIAHAAMNDKRLRQALVEALIEPDAAALEAMVRRGVERGEVAADNPAARYIAALLFGALRTAPLVEGCYADADYLVGCVDAVALPALGLGEPVRAAGRSAA
ncbi:TetR family transcriptional regulator [Mangrovactinospora gilvigrisea]|uniref:TetR family transcriptional regulator n=1 Tax=Mangrovactinospora gilvigrisea TaxID=1428644 RepID=A0A1J7BQV8_9ACTN|nr:TetR family transcriptional regulator [Mangrovactinospora gilvigrisea]